MTKRRNTTKPQGTLSVEDVTMFYLNMWALRDAIATGNLQEIDAAYMEMWDVVPCTTTNDGARIRARNIRRKQDELEQAAKEQPKRRFGDLSLAERQEAIDRLHALVMRELAPTRRFDDLTDGEQVAHLRGMWGEG